MSSLLFDFDNNLRQKKKIQTLCGIDETGRGCWAGPLVAGAVILKPDAYIEGLNDSKKLSESKRLDLDEEIKNNCISWAVYEVGPQEIDRKGITYANIKAMQEAAKLCCKKAKIDLSAIDLFVIDQSPCKNLIPYKMLPKADSTSACVAAASIIAKNYRDSLIKKINDKFSNYKFDEHNGYINQLHIDCVKKFGLIKGVHRESFNVKGFNDAKQISMVDFLNEN